MLRHKRGNGSFALAIDEIASTTTSLGRNRWCAFCTEGISVTQVCHQVAQNRITTTLPRCAARSSAMP